MPAAPLLALLLAAPPAGPVSIDPAALADARRRLSAAVESDRVVGGSHLVGLNGETPHFAAAGVRDAKTGEPFTRDTVVRVYSMTKPVVSVAAMTLHEAGQFELDDPVSEFIPAFADATVWENGGEVPPKRPVTVRDLFRHTSGLAYGGNGNPAVGGRYRRAGLFFGGPSNLYPPEMTLEQAADRLAEVPLLHHPGERFTYGFSTDLLGRLIEVWSGEPLDEYLKTAVFEPLEMTHTGFMVAEADRDRFASVHGPGGAVVDAAATSRFREGFPFLSGGGGLVSTIDDYARFCEMLAGGGERDGRHVLNAETLDLMFTDQLGGVAGNFRFGLGFALSDVPLGRHSERGEDRPTATQASWAGYASTDFRVVPEFGLYQIVLRQRVPTDPSPANALFRTVYDRVRLGGDVGGEAAVKEQAAGDWPGWLGPDRDGRVAGFDPPAWWLNPDGREPRVVWEREVGAGYGSPLVSGDRVFLHARRGGEEALWCLGSTDGGVVWRRAWAVPFKASPGGESHGAGPKASPLRVQTPAGPRIVTQSITGEVRAWDAATGEPAWDHDVKDRFPPGRPNWGATGSPAAFDSPEGPRVLGHLGTDEAGAITALDAATGAAVWERAGDGPSYASPVVANIDGVPQAVVWTHEAVVGVSLEDGAELWRSPLPHVGGDQNMPTPVVHGGVVLMGAENRGVRALEPTRAGGGWVVEELWRQDGVALDMATAVIAGDLLYGFSHYRAGQLFCLDPATGAVLWAGKGRGGRNATLLSVPPRDAGGGDRTGRVLALLDGGEVRVLAAAGADTRVTGTVRVADGGTWVPPVLLPEGLLVKAGDTLRLLAAPPGAPDPAAAEPVAATELIDFSRKDEADRRVTVNDDVMGGKSRGGPTFGDDRLVFAGATNTDGGGFSSIRTKPREWPLDGAAGLRMRVRGDGRTYQADVSTQGRSLRLPRRVPGRLPDEEGGVGRGERPVLRVPTHADGPRRRDRVPELEAKDVRTLGFMIDDGGDGPFRPEVDWIEADRPGR